jgi:hypothetical protein
VLEKFTHSLLHHFGKKYKHLADRIFQKSMTVAKKFNTLSIFLGIMLTLTGPIIHQKVSQVKRNIIK